MREKVASFTYCSCQTSCSVLYGSRSHGKHACPVALSPTTLVCIPQRCFVDVTDATGVDFCGLGLTLAPPPLRVCTQRAHAEQTLTRALQECDANATGNRRRILASLVPLRMRMGEKPISLLASTSCLLKLTCCEPHSSCRWLALLATRGQGAA